MNAVLLFIPAMVLFGEVSELSENSQVLFSVHFWVVMTIAGLLGLHHSRAHLQHCYVSNVRHISNEWVI